MTEELKGRAKSGKARAAALTKEKRSEIARKAAVARWDETIVKATHGSPDSPLRIGNVEIPCYVLEDGTRVLSGRGMQSALALGQSHGAKLRHFLTSSSLKPFISDELAMVLLNPIKFVRPGRGGKVASGYEATFLTEICNSVLEARKQNALPEKYLFIADQCEVLVRGFARVGIIALIDEATGYQFDRKKDALSKILEAFIAKELQPYVKTFPNEFYEEMFRLRGLKFPTDIVKRPPYFGLLTNDIVYKRLAPGVLEELKQVTPKSAATGRYKNKLFQMLTDNKGYPKLKEHLVSTITIMKLSDDWQDFISKMNRLHPKYDETLPLLLDYHSEQDDGIGL